VQQVVITDVPAKLLMRRRDVRTAAWQVAAQSAQIGIAQADYFPAITLLGSIGWSSNTISGTPEVRSIAAGPALTWNILDYGRIRNNVRPAGRTLAADHRTVPQQRAAGGAGNRRRRDQRGQDRRTTGAVA
jgi:outer membrane protein TolC